MSTPASVSFLFSDCLQIHVLPQFKSLTLSHPNQTSPNKNLVQKLAHSLSYFPISKIPSSCYPLCFPIPFSWFFHPSFSALSSRLFSLNLHTSHVNELNQTHPDSLFPFQIFLILQGFSGFLSFFDFGLTAGPLTKMNQIELKMKSGKKGENGYEKRAGRVLVLLALCVIFRILPESKTRTNLI